MKLLISAGVAMLGVHQAVAASCSKAQVEPYAFGSYYAEALNKSGAELRASLNKIISSNVKSQSYSCVWNMIEEADEDPGNPDNVILIYNQQSYPKAAKSGRSYPGPKWNREHLWAKSHGFPKKSQAAYTDGHHLTASDETCNSRRGNLDFGEGGHWVSGCNSQTNGNTWTPPQQNRGDIARSLFYMAVRYEGNDGSRTPNLNLADNLTSVGRPLMGKLCTLYQWHKDDPV